eukprot:4122210-Alexandrium_andersonii.AAC.1
MDYDLGRIYLACQALPAPGAVACVVQSPAPNFMVVLDKAWEAILRVLPLRLSAAELQPRIDG